MGRVSLVDDTEESLPTMNADVETNIKELIGLFDLPAFARRGQDLEITVRRLHERCRSAREELLDMVRLRLRQWSHAATGPQDWSEVFSQSIEPLWVLSHAEDPQWADSPASIRRRLTIGHDLIASVVRFNHRFTQFLGRLNLEPANLVIDQYNRYYVFEKECVMGSARLAAQHFSPVPKITIETLLHDHPTLPVPQLLDRRSPLSALEPFSQSERSHEETGNHESSQAILFIISLSSSRWRRLSWPVLPHSGRRTVFDIPNRG